MRTTGPCLLFVLFWCLPGHLFSQGNEWTWKGGDTVANASAHYGSKGVSSSTNWPGPRSLSSNWKDINGNFWMFGGMGTDAAGAKGFLNDLWKYNPETETWTWVSGDSLANKKSIYQSSSTNAPGSRSRCASWVDNQGNLWLFGGYGFADVNNYAWFNDLWKFSPATNEWSWLKGDTTVNSFAGEYGAIGVSNPDNYPPARLSPACWKDNNDNLWFFGGQGAGYRNDIWRYTIANNEWTWMGGDSIPDINHHYGIKGTPHPANTPGARVSSMCWSDNSDFAWIFGGNAPFTTQTNSYNDLWRYNMATNTWTWIKGDTIANTAANYGTQGMSSSTNNPGARALGMITTDENGNAWLIGGVGYGMTNINSGYLNDIWKYNSSTAEWTWVKGDVSCNPTGVYNTSSSVNTPGGKTGGITWTDSSGAVWMFGGYGGLGGYDNQNDLWKYTPAFSTLPVDLFTFTGKLLEDNRAHLTWITENEHAISGYLLERSANGKDFASVAMIPARNSMQESYAYDDQLDEHLLNKKDYLYYKLKIIGDDGTSRYSNVVRLRLDNPLPGIVVYPNPANSFVNITADHPRGKAMLQITDATGKLYYNQIVEIGPAPLQVSLTKYPAGIYNLTVYIGSNVFVKRIVVIK